jgi:hypothetical protein
MKENVIVHVLCCFTAASLFAQPIPRQSIADTEIGWIKVYQFKGAKTRLTVDDKIYSVHQLSLCDSFVNWMQASYIPKGGLGDVKKAVSEKLGLYNQHTSGKPQRFGAYAKTYTELRYNSNRKMEPMTNSHVWWGVFANSIPGDWPVRDICTAGQYYFVMPTADIEVEDEKTKRLLDLSRYENIKPYSSFWIKNMGFGGGMENVLLCKDNRSPFIKITKGEYLAALESSIPVYYEKEKKKISEAEQGNQQRMVLPLKQLDEKIKRFNDGLKNNKAKYKNRLSEPAMTHAQPSLNDLDNGRDVFTSQYLTDPESTAKRYAVYRVDPAVAALCKKDAPQWILVSWEYWPGNATEQQQHDAIINNFNFQYVYNFFFDPAKVKGQPYKPLRSPSAKNR